jgi:hypothetical protein
MVKPHSPIAQCKVNSSSSLASNEFRKKIAAQRQYQQQQQKTPSFLVKRVGFDNRIRVKEIKHHNDMTIKAIQATWHNEDEYAKIKDVLKQTIRLMMAGRTVDEERDGLCTRGLEGRTREGQNLRNKRRNECRRAVLMEQEKQRKITGTFDDEQIAENSCIHSAVCNLEARVAAMTDHQEAFKYLEQYEESDCNNNSRRRSQGAATVVQPLDMMICDPEDSMTVEEQIVI